MIDRCLRIVATLWMRAGGCLTLFAVCSAGCAGQKFLAPGDWQQNIENLLQEPAQSPWTLAKKPHLSPADCSAELAKGRNLERAGKYDEARTIYQRLIVNYPNRYEAYHRLGVVADYQRRHREAQALYSQAIQLQLGDAELFNDLGYCLYLQGKLEKAESALLKAVTLRPSCSRYRNNLGLILGHLGCYEEALEQFCRGGSEADAYYNLAFVRASREEVEEAKKCFRLALGVDPTYEPARVALAAFEEFDNDPSALDYVDPVVKDGATWVPYVEQGAAKSSETVEPASHGARASADDTNPSSRGGTQALLKRARTLMSLRTAKQQQR